MNAPAPQSKQALDAPIVRYSRGRDKFDNKPQQLIADSPDEFLDEILAERGRSREKGQAYICAPLVRGEHQNPEKYPGEDHWRDHRYVMPWSILTFDCDGFDTPESFRALLGALREYHGCAYTTASHTPQNPRCRVVLTASRTMGRAEGVAARESFEQHISKLVPGIKFDPSVHKGEQPLYLPLRGAESWRFNGEPVDVDRFLVDYKQQAAEPRKPQDAPEWLSGAPSRAANDNLHELCNGYPSDWIQVLNRIDPNLPRPDWVSVIMAVHGLNQSNGHELALEWSRRFTRGEFDQRAFDAVWVSHDPSRRDQPGMTRLRELAERYPRAEPCAVTASEPDAPRDVQADMDNATPEMPREAKRASGSWLVSIRELLEPPPPRHDLVRGILPAESQALIFGDPAVGKSLMTLDMAACIATGRPWAGRKVRQSPVIYIAGEGHFGIRRRLRAWTIHNDCEDTLQDAPLVISRTGTAFTRAESMDGVFAALDEFAETIAPPRLIVVDTLHRNLGGDENSPVDMGVYFERADRMRERYGATVLTVHHSGHAEKARGRGSSSIRAAVDTEYLIECDKHGARTMSATKMKDGATPPPLHFELKEIVLPWQDIAGELETSAVLAPTEPAQTGPKMTQPQRIAHAALADAIRGNGGAPVGEKAWREMFERERIEGSADAKRKAFTRARDELVKLNLIQTDGEKWWIE